MPFYANLYQSDIRDREKINIPANVVDQLVNGTQSDIRQVLNILSTWKRSHDSMNWDEGSEVYVPLMQFS